MYNVFTMPSGMRVVTQQIPHFYSVALGVWVGTGSIAEQEGEHGISHMLEHMVFKGTGKRTAVDIAAQMDGIGGNINAFTSKECTCFHARVAGEHLPLAMDILADLVCDPLLSEEELVKEKQVVLEEISMLEDTPEDLVQELLEKVYFGSNPLAAPISGTPEEVKAYTRDDLVKYWKKHYRPENMVFSIVGNFQEDGLRDLLEKAFCFTSFGVAAQPQQTVSIPSEENFIFRHKKIEQAHVCLGYRGYTHEDDLWYPSLTLNNVLGNGMSSRLFQCVREQLGLAYSVYSFPAPYQNEGMFGIYVGLQPPNILKALEAIHRQTDELAAGKMTEEEFVRAKEQLKGSYILAQDSVSGRMVSLGRGILVHNRVIEEEEVLRKIAAVTPEQVTQAASAMFQQSRSAASLVAPMNAKSVARAQKALLG